MSSAGHHRHGRANGVEVSSAWVRHVGCRTFAMEGLGWRRDNVEDGPSEGMSLRRGMAVALEEWACRKHQANRRITALESVAHDRDFRRPARFGCSFPAPVLVNSPGGRVCGPYFFGQLGLSDDRGVLVYTYTAADSARLGDVDGGRPKLSRVSSNRFKVGSPPSSLDLNGYMGENPRKSEDRVTVQHAKLEEYHAERHRSRRLQGHT